MSSPDSPGKDEGAASPAPEPAERGAPDEEAPSGDPPEPAPAPEPTESAGAAEGPQPDSPRPGSLPEPTPDPEPVTRERPRSLTDFERAAFSPEGSEDPEASDGLGPPPAPPNRRSADPPTGRFLREGLLSALRAPFLRSLLRVPLKKIAIWASFLGLIYFLRDFFGLIFLTFVLSYIAATIVERISPYFSSRRVPVVLVFVTLVLAIVGLGAATIPRAIGFGEAQLQKLAKIEDPKHYVEVRLAELFDMEPPNKDAKGAKPGAKTGDPSPQESAKTGDPSPQEPAKTGDPSAQEPAKTGEPSAQEPAKTGDSEEESEKKKGLTATVGRYLSSPAINKATATYLGKAGQDYLIPGLKSIVKGLYVGVAYCFAAIIFSFLIVWDLPRLAAGTRLMERSRLGDVWGEVAPSIGTFFTLLGKAFEAQTMIALVNTAITSLGMWILEIPGLGFLAVVVFLCSFIPIVGMIISTVPMCLAALTAPHGGLGLVIAVCVMVAIAHAIEAYILNPRIYGFHMNLHPLAVLIVLYLGQHLFGMWGLVMGVPMATYVWRHLIMGVDEDEDPAPPLPTPTAAG